MAVHRYFVEAAHPSLQHVQRVWDSLLKMARPVPRAAAPGAHLLWAQEQQAQQAAAQSGRGGKAQEDLELQCSVSELK
eukprot:3139508-Prymnesium_polylepis.1